MAWLDELPEQQQETVLKLAATERKNVSETNKREMYEREEKRQQNLRESHNRREARKRKQQALIQDLSQKHLIGSHEELSLAIAEIENRKLTATKRKSEKMNLIKTQIHIRKKVLNQK